MEKLKIIIIEDTANPTASVQQLLKNQGILVQAFVNSSEKALRHIETNRPEIILLDMKTKSKISLKEVTKIFHEEYSIPVVFMTDDHDIKLIDKARDAGAYGIVYRPFDEKQLKAVLEFALLRHDNQMQLTDERNRYLAMIDKKSLNQHLFVRADYKLNKINLSDIYYVEALKDYVNIYTTNKVYTTHATMKTMQRTLPYRDFVRIHRSYIVRFDKILSIKYPDLLLQDIQKPVPIGGLYRKELYKRLNLL